jgi:hypothetical protein
MEEGREMREYGSGSEWREDGTRNTEEGRGTKEYGSRKQAEGGWNTEHKGGKRYEG